jgi:hypothetical protein
MPRTPSKPKADSTKKSKKDKGPKEKKKPSAYNIFVKKEMAKIKAENSSLSHKEVFKLAASRVCIFHPFLNNTNYWNPLIFTQYFFFQFFLKKNSGKLPPRTLKTNPKRPLKMTTNMTKAMKNKLLPVGISIVAPSPHIPSILYSHH